MNHITTSAMVMATLFDPLKRRIDALVDRLFVKQGEGGIPASPAEGPAGSSR